MDLRLSDTVILVTGASRGLGAAMAIALADEGAHVIAAARSKDSLAEVAAQGSGRISVVEADMSSQASVAALVPEVVARHGRIDGLINNAGIAPAGRFVDQDPQVWKDALTVNVLAPMLLAQAAGRRMIEQGGGRIVNIAGTSGLRGYRNRIGYSSSKWAVRGLSRTLALELGPHGITVNAICPNVTNGERMDRIVTTKAERTGRTYDEVYADFASQTALGRFVDEVDIAAAVGFLVSEGARNITGQDIIVDAGWSV